MKNPKIMFYGAITIGTLLIIAYFVSSMIGLDLLSNVLSPLIAGLCAVAMVYSYRKSTNKKAAGKVFIFYAISFFSWVVADIFWAACFATNANPTDCIQATIFYFITNIFISIVILIFNFYHFKQFKSFQLLLDINAIGLLNILFIWITFFQKKDTWLEVLFMDGWFSLISIVGDFLILIGIVIIVYSFRNIKSPKYAYFFLIGILLFALNDSFYYYSIANNFYLPNSITDVIYVGAFFIITVGALIRTLFEPNKNIEIPSNMGIGKRWLALFIYPLITIFFEGFVFFDVFYFITVIMIYRAISLQFHLSIKNKELYLKELEINNTLEKRIEEQFAELNFLANKDTVTMLYNRRFFVNSIEETLSSLDMNEVLSVFIIDVDRFKTVNDSFGHDVGDKVLIELSNRLHECVKDKAVLARLGGDEFALFFRGKYSEDDLEKFAKDIIEYCSPPIIIGKHKLYITLSIGISIYKSVLDDRVTLMQNADIAMYRAKSLGYNKYVFYDPFFKASIEKKNEIEVMLKKANIEKDFELFYQPQFSLLDNKLIGVEALIRWKSAERGYIVPNEFISIAEEIDYINKIGKWVMHEAIRQIIKWNITYSMNLKIGINISPKQLYEDDFLTTLNTIIKKEHFNTTWLDAEITENIMIEESNRTNLIFQSFKKLGVSISLDDFGAGYSSWGYLNKYPFNRIKIDRTLIEQLSVNNKNSLHIVKAIISMSRDMGKLTIAEGVETKEQLEILKKLGCEQAQGFLLGRPVSVDEFEEAFIKKI